MRLFETIGRRLDQSVGMMNQLGIELDMKLTPEHQLRGAIVRCALCRHGEECRDWIDAGRSDEPEFCPSRHFYRRHLNPGMRVTAPD